MDRTREEIRAWAAATNIAQFLREMDSETDVFRYKTLEVLLAREYEKFEKEPLP